MQQNSRRFGVSAVIVEEGIGGQGIRSFIDCATRAKLVKYELGGKKLAGMSRMSHWNLVGESSE